MTSALRNWWNGLAHQRRCEWVACGAGILVFLSFTAEGKPLAFAAVFGLTVLIVRLVLDWRMFRGDWRKEREK